MLLLLQQREERSEELEQGAVAVASYDELYRVHAAPVGAALSYEAAPRQPSSKEAHFDFGIESF